MSTITRREAAKRMLAGGAGLLTRGWPASAAPMIDSVIEGVRIGAQSYSFRDRGLDACIEAYVACGLGECELWQGHVEPKEMNREALRHWRLTVPLAHFHEIRRKLDRAGVLLYAYNYSFRKDFSDGEIDRGFQMARALGVKYITASSNVSLARKLDGYARKYRIVVGFHNHDDTADPDEFSTAATFERALSGASRWLGINLDIGHFVASNGDPVEFLRQYHSRLVTLHLKDRKRNHGPDTPWGEGDTPIAAVLRLLRDRRWKIPGNIEYEYGKPGMDTIAEVKKCYAICRKILTTHCAGHACYEIG